MAGKKATPVKQKRGVGAKGLYKEWLEPDKLTLLRGWALDGLTNEQIANNVGIAPATLYVWMNKYEEIAESLRKNKEVADKEIENKLYKKAFGGLTTKKVVRERVFNEDTQQYEMMVTKEEDIELAPDNTAMIFWLKNRAPDVWREKKHTEVSGGMEVNNALTNLSTEELRKMVEKMKLIVGKRYFTTHSSP